MSTDNPAPPNLPGEGASDDTSDSDASSSVSLPGPEVSQAEYDAYWLDHVYSADRTPQITARALVTGVVLGGIMSFSNLYIGLKTGWGLGASITAAIMAYALFSAVHKATRSKTPFTVLENNTMQTAASAAASMTSAGLVSAIPALYLVTGQTLSAGQTVIWLIGVSLMGVVAAIPVKKKLINQERLAFPSGIACAETLNSLHADGAEGRARAAKLGQAGLIGVIVAVLKDGAGLIPSTLPVFGKALAKKTVAFEPSTIMVAAGAIIGMRVALSMVVAGAITWVFAPQWLWDAGFIECLKLPEGETCTFEMLGYKDITTWTLWPGVALMVAHSLTGLAFQAPQMIRGLKRTFGQKDSGDQRMNEIEIPNTWFLAGLVVAGSLAVTLQSQLFAIPVPYGVLSVFMALGLAFVAARATGETDITPVGAMGKVTQLVFGGLIRGQVAPNLMAANLTGGAASQAADLLTDLKTGHLLGAKPRYQLIAQVLGVMGGSVFATFAYFTLINPDQLGTEVWPAPAAITWAAVAELLSQGLDSVPGDKIMAIQAGLGVGVLMAILEMVLPKRVRRFMPSVAGVGIAVMIPFFNSLSMFIGAAIAMYVARIRPKLAERFTIVVSSGFIAGETLAAVGIIVWTTLAG